MNKRGIAPLIATLLLISFAVALGVVIMTFGKAQVELEAECPINIGLKLSEIAGEDQICYNQNNGQITFTVENGVNTNVEGLVINIIGSQQAQSVEDNNAKISKAAVYNGQTGYDQNQNGNIRQTKIIPKIILYDAEQICVEKALVAENIRPC